MPSTYTPISSQTLVSATSSVTFSSIPSTYTDLVLICNLKTATDASLAGRINGDTGANYSRISLAADGSSVQSTAGSATTYGIWCTFGYASASNFNAVAIVNINNYSSANVKKTVMVSNSNGLTGVSLMVSTWNNTAAVNSVTLLNDGGANFSIGCAFTLYGIKAA
jgi:hypothetical protein